MGIAVTARVQVGRDVLVQAERADGVELEGFLQLAPGHPVQIVYPRGPSGGREVRRAVVWSWAVTRLGSGRPLYQGFCQWQ
jgi:hypothetical protein